MRGITRYREKGRERFLSSAPHQGLAFRHRCHSSSAAHGLPFARNPQSASGSFIADWHQDDGHGQPRGRCSPACEPAEQPIRRRLSHGRERARLRGVLLAKRGCEQSHEEDTEDQARLDVTRHGQVTDIRLAKLAPMPALLPRHGLVEPHCREKKVVARFCNGRRTLCRRIDQPHLILFGEAEIDEEVGIVNFHVERLGLHRRLERKRKMQRQHGLFRIVLKIIVDRV